MALQAPTITLADGRVLTAEQYDALTNPGKGMPEPRSALGEIGTGIKRGVMVDVPSMFGQALKSTGQRGDTLYDTGQSIAQSAQARGQQPGYQLNPSQHNAVTNALTEGGEMIGPMVPTIAAGLVNPLAGAGVAAATFGPSSYQDTYERVKDAGGTDDAAHAAGLKAGAIMGVGGALLGRIGTGVVGGVSSKLGAATAEGTFDSLAAQGSRGLLVPLAQRTAATTAETAAVNAAQIGGVRAVEQDAGVSGESPLSAAVNTIPASLGLSAFGLPFAAMHLHAETQRIKSDLTSLTDTSQGAEQRMAASQRIGAQLEAAPPAGADPVQWKTQIRDWRSAALEAANAGQPIDMAPTFSSDWAGSKLAAEQAARNDAYRTQFIADAEKNAAPEEPAPAMSPVDEFLAGAHLGKQIKDTTPPAAKVAEEPPGGAALHAELGVQEGMRTIAQEAAAEKAVQNKQSIDFLHMDVKDALTRAGVTPEEPQSKAVINKAFKKANPDAKQGDIQAAYAQHQEDVMRRNADTLDNLPKPGAKPQQPETIPVKTEAGILKSPVVPTNNQLGTKLAHAMAEKQQTAQKQAELDKLQNLANADRAAKATPDGTVPLTAKYYLDTWKEQGLANGVDLKGIRGQTLAKVKAIFADAEKQPSFAKQLETLRASRDKMKAETVSRDSVSMLIDHLEKTREDQKISEGPESEPAAGQARSEVAGDGIQGDQRAGAAKPARTDEAGQAQPVQKVASADHVDQAPKAQQAEAQGPKAPAAEAVVKTAAKTDAQSAHDAVKDVVDAFKEKTAAKEKLTPAEQRRYDAAHSILDTMKTIVSRADSKRPLADDYVRDMVDIAKEVLTPEAFAKAEKDNSEFAGTPDTPSPILQRALTRFNTVKDILSVIKATGSEPWVKAFAEKLQALDLQATIEHAGQTPPRAGLLGSYGHDTNHIRVWAQGETEHIVLHEITHAATVARYRRGLDMLRGTQAAKSEADGRLKKAVAALNDLYTTLAHEPDAKDIYGLKDPLEFIAEANTNKEFQQWLASKQVGATTWWGKLVEAISRLLGNKVPVDALEKVMSVQDVLFSNEKPMRSKAASAFETKPTERIDQVLSGLGRTADKLGAGAKITGMKLKTFKAFLGWQTVFHMGEIASADPKLKVMGAKVKDYAAAHDARRAATESVGHAAGDYMRKLELALNKYKVNERRELSKQMMTLAGEGSILGVDLSKNFNDNKKLDPRLSIDDKPYIDKLHGQYKTLAQSHPELIKAIKEGELLNRKGYVGKMATLLVNVLHGNLHGSEAVDAQALLDNYAPLLDIMNKDLAKEPNTAPGKHLDGASAALDTRINALFSDAKQLDAASGLRAQLAEAEQLYRKQIDNPYFHLGRDGDYFVRFGVKPGDTTTYTAIQNALAGTNKVLGDMVGGRDHAFFRFDTLEQAQAIRDALGKLGEGVIDLEHGKLSEGDKLNSAAGMNTALRSMLASLQDSLGGADGLTTAQQAKVKEALAQQFMSMLPETSPRKALMRRAGVPGYEGDFVQNFSKRAAGNAQETGNMYSARQFTEAFKGMGDTVKTLRQGSEGDVSTRAQMLHDELALRYTNGMTPVKADAVNLINAFGHSFYLAMSPAFIIRNTLQPYHRTLPMLGGRYGFVRSAKEIGKGTGLAMKIIAATIKQGYTEGGVRGVLDAGIHLKGMGLSESEVGFMQAMIDRGILNLGQSYQLGRMAAGGDIRVADAARFAAMTAQYSEMLNRITAGIAAFRMSKDVEYAIKTVNATMDNFSPDNTARQIGKKGVIGEVTPLATSFMNYQLQTMEQIGRMVHEGFFNQDKSAEGKQRSLEAKKSFAGLLGTTAVLSGVMGLPFANVFAAAFNAFNDQDDPSDIRQSVRSWLSLTFGKDMGEIIAHGPSRALGVDLSTAGLQNLMPGSEFLADRRMIKDKLESQSQQLLGPALNAGIDITVAAQKIADGYWAKGIEQALPSGLKAYFKAGELADKGFTDAKGNPIGITTTPWDIAVQATGLAPSKKAEQSEASQYFSVNEALLAHRKQILSDQLFKAVQNDDGEGQQKVLAKIAEFNDKNPYSPVKGSGTFKTNARGLAVARGSGTGIAARPKMLPKLEDEYGFANTGND